MVFRTEVMPERAPFCINHNTPTLLIGSCFAQHIGRLMANGKMPTLTNPFGTMYNPMSVAQCIEHLLNPTPIDRDALFEHQGVWRHFDFHSELAHSNPEQSLTSINSAITNGAEFLQRAKRLVITFGTARIYSRTCNGQPVANCHKLPAAQFTHKLMPVEQISILWNNLIAKLLNINPNLKIVFTVSPIRHWKDGAVENQRSKASLLLAVAKLTENHPQAAYYFPAYELLMDDLRDYRFYADDMLHPAPQAVEYVWEKFKQAAMEHTTHDLLAQIARVQRAVAHRPFNPHTDAHKHFVQQTLDAMTQIESKHPHINFTAERQQLRNNLG